MTIVRYPFFHNSFFPYVYLFGSVIWTTDGKTLQISTDCQTSNRLQAAFQDQQTKKWPQLRSCLTQSKLQSNLLQLKFTRCNINWEKKNARSTTKPVSIRERLFHSPQNFQNKMWPLLCRNIESNQNTSCPNMNCDPLWFARQCCRSMYSSCSNLKEFP